MKKLLFLFTVLLMLFLATGCAVGAEDEVDVAMTAVNEGMDTVNNLYGKYKTRVAAEVVTETPINEPTAPVATNTLAPTAINTLRPVEATPTKTLVPTATKTTAPTTLKTFFVSNSGSDSNPGTFEQPWKTLVHASKNIKAGYTLYIRTGTYVEATSWEVDGTESAPITIKAYNGEHVVIDGENRIPAYVGGTWIFMVWGDWYTVEDLEVKQSYDEGGIGVKGAHVTIRNNFVHHNWGSGITMMGDYGLAENNRVWYNSVSNEFGARTRGGWSATLTCARYPNYCTLRNNISWENWGEGISTFEAYYTTIENNVSFDNMQNFYISDTKYTVLNANLSYCTPKNLQALITSQSGILVGDEKQNPASSNNVITNNLVHGCERNLAIGTTESTNNLVANNTFVNAVSQQNILIYYGTVCTNCVFANNIIVQEDALSIMVGAGTAQGWTFKNNIWSKNPGSDYLGSNSLITSPMLSKTVPSTSPNWYELLAGSPAINAGANVSVTTDYYDELRDSMPDIGAIER